MPFDITDADVVFVTSVMEESRSSLLKRIQNLPPEEQAHLLFLAACAWYELSQIGLTAVYNQDTLEQIDSPQVNKTKTHIVH